MLQKIVIAAAVFFTIGAQQGFAVPEDPSLCKIADEALVEASTIRGLKIKHKVPCVIQDRDAVKDYLLSTIKTKIPQGKLGREGFIYKELGFIPESFDYEKGLVDLYVSQLGGYYDPEKARYAMAAWMPALLQTTVAVHELTHALQDQYFNLKTFMDEKIENSDYLLAHSALVEGDATAVMIDYPRKLAGQGSLSKEPNVDAILLQNVLGASLMAGFTGAPQSLQALLLFPYNSGLRFVHRLLQKGGYAEVNKAFARPPRSTEEILHPEKYLVEKADYIEFTDADLTTPEIPSTAKVVYRDTYGEFAISALLSMSSEDKSAAADAAAGWGGDRIVMFEDDTASYIVWRSRWETEKDMKEFYTLFLGSFQKRYPALSSDAAKSLVSVAPKKTMRITPSDKEVIFVEKIEK